jgi:ubiquitin-protein ligase
MIFKDFPKKPPHVYFVSHVYHPYVNFETGLVDLGDDLEKEWNYGT